MTLCASAAAVPAAPQHQPPLNCHSQWNPDGPDSPHASDDIDLALAALMKGLPEVNWDELETLLNDLPMPEQGAKDGIFVREAVEVSSHTI